MFVHGDNLTQKEFHTTKYTDDESKRYLREIRVEYDKWRKANLDLKGPGRDKTREDHKFLQERVKLFSEYKDFIDKQKYAEKFDSRSNLHSSVLEEFIYYLFKDLVAAFSAAALIGKAHTFKDIFFQPSNYADMVSTPNIRIEKKDHDFVIGVNIEATFSAANSSTSQKETLQIPAIAIECKTYLDKTMLEASSTAAHQLLTRNPNAIYIVVAEWLKLTESVNLRKYQVDQIYILRKQKNTDREFRYDSSYVKKPVHYDVVHHLFNFAREHLTRNWEGGIEFGLDKGYLI